MINYDPFPCCHLNIRVQDIIIRREDIPFYPSRLYSSGKSPCVPKKGHSSYYSNLPPKGKYPISGHSHQDQRINQRDNQKGLEAKVKKQEIKSIDKKINIEKENKIQNAFKRSSKKSK
jgi:hypothetical protein